MFDGNDKYNEKAWSKFDDYEKDPKHYDYTKYLKELDKVKTRGLTTFYFNDRNNKDIQEYGGRQYNEKYEFGGKVVQYDEEKSDYNSFGFCMHVVIMR